MSKINREQLGELLSAYIDGELDPEQEKLIEGMLQEDEDAQCLLDDLRRTVKLVSSLPRHPAPDSIAEDVQLRVERSELLGEVEEAGVRTGGWRNPAVVVLSMAAMLALVFGSFWLTRVDETSSGGPRGNIVALAPGKDSEAESSDFNESIPSAAREMEGRLLATASLDQKFRAGMGLDSVLTHRFDNEAVRLQVTVRDRAERDAVTTKLVAYLAERGVVDLADVASDERRREAPAGTFYYQGSTDVNFTAGNEQQILLRVSRRELEATMDELAGAAGARNVELVAGPLAVRGRHGARKALDGPGVAAPGRAAEHPTLAGVYEGVLLPDAAGDTNAATSGLPPPRANGLLDDFLSLFGPDAEALSKALRLTMDSDLGASSTPSGRDVAAELNREESERNVPPTTAGGANAQAVPESVGEASMAGKGAAKDAAVFRPKEASRKKSPGPSMSEPESLVDRHIKALEDTQRRRFQTASKKRKDFRPAGRRDRMSVAKREIAAGPSNRIDVAEKPATPYITFVVQVIPAKPNPNPTARQIGTSLKPIKKRSSKASRAE